MWDSLLPLFTTFQANFKTRICNLIGCQKTVKLQQGNYNHTYVTAIGTNKTARSWATYGNTVDMLHCNLYRYLVINYDLNYMKTILLTL